MFYANDSNGKRVYVGNAFRLEKYVCPACGGKLVLKQGDIISHHFAHAKRTYCDQRYHDNTKSLWHREMQNLFPERYQEVVIWNEGHSDFRIADVQISYKEHDIVIELQHSPISSEEFIQRSTFYLDLGYRIIWIFDYCTQTPPKTIYFEDDEYVYEGEHGLVSGIKKYHWPGRDRVKLFGSNQFLDFVRENECNSKESSLQVFFYVCTGLGKRIECMTNSGQFYNCWNYIDPFHRTQEYLRIFFEDSESSSAFFAIPYNKEEFEMRLKNI